MRVIINNTKGGVIAHTARRLFHIGMLAIPFIYYYFLTSLASEKILHLLILAFIFLVFLVEKIRIRWKLVVFGQRLHEATHISAFAWTVLSLGIILIVSPSLAFSIPIIASCALADPLLGEMRARGVNKKIAFFSGIVLVFLIWFFCALHYHFSFWIAFLMAPLTIAVEWPTFKWIDDNALMLLVPTIMTLLIDAAFFK